MNTITSDELRTRMIKHEPVFLVMALSSLAYNQAHIPGSVGVEALSDLIKEHNFDREVVVYDTNSACPASYRAYYQLEHIGFAHVRCLKGGIEEWVAAGFPIEGSLVGNSQ